MVDVYYTNTYAGQDGSYGLASHVDEEFDDLVTSLTTASNAINAGLKPTGLTSLEVPIQSARDGKYLSFSGGVPVALAATTIWPTATVFLGTLSLRLASGAQTFASTSDVAFTRTESHHSPFYRFPEDAEPNEAVTCMKGTYTFMFTATVKPNSVPLDADIVYQRDTGGGFSTQETQIVDRVTDATESYQISLVTQETQTANFDIKYRVEVTSGSLDVSSGHLLAIRWDV